MSHEKFQSCIDACIECATQCDHCTSECLKEDDVKMLSRCIQLERECSQMCLNAAKIMMLGSEHSGDECATCAEYCDRCAEECEKHSHMEHCKKCAEACRKCAKECRVIAEQHHHHMS
jgi:hypothetical protein